MSEITTPESTPNQQITNVDTSIIFLRDNTYLSGSFTNGTGGQLVIPAGQLMGRIAANEELAILESAAVDGSQFPVGILTQELTIEDTITAQINVGVEGEVAKEKVVFDGGDGFDTIVDGRILLDRIGSDTVGIKLVAGTELTGLDNQ